MSRSHGTSTYIITYFQRILSVATICYEPMALFLLRYCISCFKIIQKNILTQKSEMLRQFAIARVKNR